MKRIAVFAHWDAENQIDDYVLFYLKSLRPCVEKLIFVSDSEVPVEELEKIKDLVDAMCVGHHGEYDFGSYKRGYLIASEKCWLADCDELVFANDSCYGPLIPFDRVFEKMETKEWDFWGMTHNLIRHFSLSHTHTLSRKKRNPEKSYHIQSYFLVFSSQVFKHACFGEFMKSIRRVDDKSKIVTLYEIGLTQLLLKDGFRCQTYADFDYVSYQPRFWEWNLRKSLLPLLKYSFSIFTISDRHSRKLLEKFSDYPVTLIEKNQKRRNVKRSWKQWFRALRNWIGYVYFMDFRVIFFLGHCFMFRDPAYRKAVECGNNKVISDTDIE